MRLFIGVVSLDKLETAYLDVEQIAGIDTWGGQTVVYLTGGHRVQVTESVEDVFGRMEECLRPMDDHPTIRLVL